MGLLRTKAQWNIPGAGSAFTVMHFTCDSGSTVVQADANDAIARTRKFFDDLKVCLPNQVTVLVQPEAEDIDVASGDMVGVWSAVVTPAVVQGTASAATGWAAPTGANVTWNTAGVRNGRRVRGRTFIVPMTTGAYDTDGTLRIGEFNVLNSAAFNLWSIAGPTSLAVYCRPVVDPAQDGATFEVTSQRLPDKCAILTSRRQ
jgi:predicted secreted protein